MKLTHIRITNLLFLCPFHMAVLFVQHISLHNKDKNMKTYLGLVSFKVIKTKTLQTG